MTTAIRRSATLAALLAVAATVLVGCGSEAGQANSAAIISGRVVSVDDVQRRLDDALQKEPAAQDLARNRKLDLVSRGIVNQLVRHELIAEAARRENLTVTDKDVADLVARSAPAEDPVQRSIEAAFDPKETARDRLLTVRLGLEKAGQTQLTLDGVALQGPGVTRESVTRLARQVAAEPNRAAELGRAAAGQDGQAEPLEDFPWNAVRRYTQALRAAQGQAPPPDALLAPLFAAPPNSVVALPLGASDQAGWLVTLVRRADSGVPAQEAQFAQDVPEDWRYVLGYHLLGPLANELGLQISPRYGVWDDLAVGVAPNENEKSGVVVPVTARQ